MKYGAFEYASLNSWDKIRILPETPKKVNGCKKNTLYLRFI